MAAAWLNKKGCGYRQIPDCADRETGTRVVLPLFIETMEGIESFFPDSRLSKAA